MRILPSCLINDAKMEAYRSITASGVENISNGHYYRNNSMLKDGDLVHMVERHHIEGRSADMIAGHLKEVYNEFC